MSGDADLRLLSLIDSFLAGTMDVLSFEDQFEAIYFDESVESKLSEAATEFFGDVHEVATFANPAGSFDEVDRAAGVITYEEYAAWLRQSVNSYRNLSRS